MLEADKVRTYLSVMYYSSRDCNHCKVCKVCQLVVLLAFLSGDVAAIFDDF